MKILSIFVAFLENMNFTVRKFHFSSSYCVRLPLNQRTQAVEQRGKNLFEIAIVFLMRFHKICSRIFKFIANFYPFHIQSIKENDRFRDGRAGKRWHFSQITYLVKVEKILNGSLDLIISPSSSCNHLNFLFSFFGQTLLGIVMLCKNTQQCFAFTPQANFSAICQPLFEFSLKVIEGDGIEFRLSSKIYFF